MNNKYRTYRILLSLYFILFFSSAFSQTPLVKTFVDKKDILIGEQIKYRVSATIPEGVFKVNWFTVPDSVAHFETVERSKIDTSTVNNNTLLEQTITFTSFDSGIWNTPIFKIDFIPLNKDSALNVFTDSIPINVGYSTADTTNQLRDIKPIMEVIVKNYLWYYIGGGILLLLVTVFLLRRYFKGRKKNPVPEFESKLSPYDEAMKALARHLPLFVSEFGTCEYTGNGKLDYEASLEWFKFLDEYKISWCNWSVSDKEETASIIKPGTRYTGKWKQTELTLSGQFIRDEIRMKNGPLLPQLELKK